jgi:hypothetical protein
MFTFQIRIEDNFGCSNNLEIRVPGMDCEYKERL